ncbi:MAG: hypothetical protein EOP93_20750, partial [Lysobacteraceae bacterium]
LALAAPALAQQPAARPAPPATPRPAADPAAETFKAWDKDHNGSLSQLEFTSGWKQLERVAEMQARLRHQFSTIDANKSGAIEVGEYANLVLVKNAGKSAPPLARFDTNANGKLEFNEYVGLVQALAPQEAAKGQAK